MAHKDPLHRVIKIRKIVDEAVAHNASVPWSKTELAALTKWYPRVGLTVTKQQLARVFPCRTYTAIEMKAARLGLRRNPGRISEAALHELEHITI